MKKAHMRLVSMAIAFTLSSSAIFACTTAPRPNLTISEEQRGEKKEVKPQSKEEVKPETKSEVAPEVKPMPKPEVKPEVKPMPKPEVKPMPKPEVKPETKPMPKPEVKPETKPMPKPMPKPEVKPETKPMPKPEVKPETKPCPKPCPKPEVKPETKPMPKPEVKPETKPMPKPEVKPETKPMPKPEVKPETKPECKPGKKPCKPCKDDETKAQGPFMIDNFKIISSALEKLGVAPEELQTMIKEGKKLPEVLEAKNIKVNQFKKVLIKQYNCAIQEGVANKQITKAEAKMLREAIKEKVMCWLKTK